MIITTESGTGCVHTAPAHGLDDHFICKKYNVETFKALNNRGLFKDDFDFIAGLPPIKADEKIIEKLQKENMLINVEDYDFRVECGDQGGGLQMHVPAGLGRGALTTSHAEPLERVTAKDEAAQLPQRPGGHHQR